jgi:hypothetical protein
MKPSKLKPHAAAFKDMPYSRKVKDEEHPLLPLEDQDLIDFLIGGKKGLAELGIRP